MNWREFIDQGLPEQHLRAINTSSDRAHDAVDFLVFESPLELLRIRDVNEFLHGEQHPDPWPPFLLAFASNGCGDYFAYDLRTPEPSIRYIDPDRFMWENLIGEDQFLFGSFSEWYELKVARRTQPSAN